MRRYGYTMNITETLTDKFLDLLDYLPNWAVVPTIWFLGALVAIAGGLLIDYIN